MWFCRNTARSLTLFSEGPALGAALAVYAPTALRAQLDQVEAQSRASDSRARLMWMAGILALSIVAGLGYFGLRNAAQASIDLVPHVADEKLGKLVFDNMEHEGKLVDDPVLVSAVRGIVDRLTAPRSKGDFPYNVHVVDADVVNAFALPGGEIVVFTGLMREAKSPEQLAGVLAHEIAHVRMRHGMRRIAQSVGVIGAIQLVFGDVSGIAAIAVEVLKASSINAYSRDHEREADREGVAILAHAGVDPNALADFFALLQKREPSLGGALSWLGTHPELAERITTVHKLAAERRIEHPAPIDLDWPNVQEHAGATKVLEKDSGTRAP
jgi:predicted Zn-dependent protease